MFNFKKFFGKNKQEEPEADKPAPPVVNNQQQPPSNEEDSLPWIAAADNPYGRLLLDLRPITQSMLSTSKDPQMATNAVSYGGEDGTVFWGQPPVVDKTISTNLSIPVDGALAAGVLFIPRVMEHKWAIYFDGENLIFVRSWARKVFVVANTTQQNGQLLITSISGEFAGNETPAYTTAYLNFLLLSHAMGQVVPAPLPKDLEQHTRQAGMWAFSCFGNMAKVGIFDEDFLPTTTEKLRSITTL